jgi:hypothetical protein
VVNGGRIGPAGAYQCYGTKGVNNVPGDAGNLQRSRTAVVNLEWSSSAVVDFQRTCPTLVYLEWPGTAVVDLKWSSSAVVNLEWPCATVVDFQRSSSAVVDIEYPVEASRNRATSGS